MVSSKKLLFRTELDKSSQLYPQVFVSSDYIITEHEMGFYIVNIEGLVPSKLTDIMEEHNKCLHLHRHTRFYNKHDKINLYDEVKKKSYKDGFMPSKMIDIYGCLYGLLQKCKCSVFCQLENDKFSSMIKKLVEEDAFYMPLDTEVYMNERLRQDRIWRKAKRIGNKKRDYYHISFCIKEDYKMCLTKEDALLVDGEIVKYFSINKKIIPNDEVHHIYTRLFKLFDFPLKPLLFMPEEIGFFESGKKNDRSVLLKKDNKYFMTSKPE